MEKPKEMFVKIENKENPMRHLAQEVLGDKNLFPEECRPALNKFVQGERSVLAKDPQFFSKIKFWWQDKYGFPFDMKEAREELLLRKYGSPESVQEISILQNNLINALAGNDEDAIKKIKKEYTEKFTDQIEGVEVIFGLRDFLIRQQYINARRESGYSINKEIFKELTKYQFLLTHYIAQNSQDKEFLEKFWGVAENLAEKTKTLRELHAMRLGILGQVATYKILEKIGKNPQLSHPQEDAFESIDLWMEKNTAIQVKSGKYVEEPAVLESENMAFPLVSVSKGKCAQYYNEKYFNETQRFKAKISKYGETINRKIKGYLLVVPTHKIDFVTGEPAEEVVEFFKEKIAKIEQDVR
jgi:hypothetical protein